MEVLCLFLVTLSVTAAQHSTRNSGYRNQDFLNARAPLSTSSGRDKPFISIPIVLLPDRQPQPKPRQAAYHYVGHSNHNGQNQHNQRDYKQRNPMVNKPAADYQVSVPPPSSPPPAKKTIKPPKLTASQLNSQLRNVQSNFPRSQGPGPNQNQHYRGQQQQYEQNQNQQIHQAQFKQQRNPAFQQQSTAPPQQVNTAHKQNVANFVNFATNIGAAVLSQQQSQQVILPTQTPAAGGSFQNSPNLKAQESYLIQRPLLANHKLGTGVTFQHQVPSLPNAQAHYAQAIQSHASAQNNGYTVHQQQHPQHQLSNSQSQQQLTNTQTQQHLSHPQKQLSHSQQQLPHSQQQLPHSQQQLPHSQQQLPHSHQPVSNSQQQLLNSQQQLSNSQPQHQQQQSQQPSQNSSPTGAYLPATTLRANIQASQGTEVHNTIPNQGNQASVVQQNSDSSLRAQTSQSDVVVLNNYNTHHQQNNNHQNYAIAIPQQTTVATHVVSNYDTQSQLPKSVVPAQQPASASAYALNAQTVQPAYTNQNQGSQENSNLNSQTHDVTYPSNSQTTSGYSTDQVSQTNVYSLQNAQSNTGQINDPLSYYQYQTTQELPLNYATFINQGQAGYISSQNVQQNDQAVPNIEHSYTFLPNTQTVFVSTGQSPFTNLQDGTSNNSPEIGIQGYDIFENEQSAYPSTSTSQTQASFINAPNVEKNYQSSQYNYLLQNSQGQLSDSQHSQSSIANSPLLYASSSPKQINYPSQSTTSSPSQQYGPSNYQSSPTFVSFSTVNANFKQDSPSSFNNGQKSQGTNFNYEQRSPGTTLNYEQKSPGISFNYDQRPPGVVTPGSTYAKLNPNNDKQPEPSTEASETSENTEYDDGEETDDEEASYKVVYIPLDILKNILSNTVENK